ncbi:CubicO group peptidase, beta-lactamase class C family [Marivirga sericea]|uniref:CubicO group peptidase, beta-lactamase class C family n=1 Tax=Marivirga sericea TaxID=1028 RepID=A0A1X7ISY3_9BACT|nr:serine hydrolase [Marivirga sericea]SMG18158.1 CubicO group peptidase, beta-lactamase class C family [Marivirga sericea]
MMEKESIAKNLVYYRKQQGLSQEKLSEKSTVTVRTIQRIEKASVNPHLDTLKLLAVGLGIQLEDLKPIDNPKEESIKTKWLLLFHGLPLLGVVVPFFNILTVLFLWVHKREDNSLYDLHGRKIINYNISITLIFIMAFIALLTVEGYGFLFFVSVVPLNFTIIIFNMFYVVKKQKCFYPFAFPFLSLNKQGKQLLIALLVIFSSCSTSTEQAITRLDGSKLTFDSLEQKVKLLMNQAEVHGLNMTILENNEVFYQNSFGYKNFQEKTALNDTTSIYGASLSKAVFGVLVMKLVEEGVLDLDTPLESYLPKKIYQYEPQTRWHDDYSDLETDRLYHKITARMCLSHTSGFPNWRWFEGDQKLRVKFEPGEKYLYSGEGMVFLQVVIEKLTGKGLEELAQEKVFTPLKMDNSSFQWETHYEADFAYGHQSDGTLYQKDKDNEPRGPSTLETTASDYALFLEAVLNKKLLSNQSWKEILQPQIRIKSKRQFGPLSNQTTDEHDNIQLSYGLSFGLLKTPYGWAAFKEGHGNGFQHYFILFPEAKTGVMFMTNSDRGKYF